MIAFAMRVLQFMRFHVGTEDLPLPITNTGVLQIYECLAIDGKEVAFQ